MYLAGHSFAAKSTTTSQIVSRYEYRNIHMSDLIVNLQYLASARVLNDLNSRCYWSR
jgi:hypothetical protein